MDGDLADANSTLAYTDINSYLALTPKKKNVDGIVQSVRPHIHAIQLGVLVQSSESTGNQAVVRERNKQSFRVLGADVTLLPANQDTHLRQTLNQTVSLRNAMGWISEGCDTSKSNTCSGGA
jgi:type IV pilus assembly protein PilW